MDRRAQIVALLARREREGLSMRKLAEKSGIPFGTLSWWSWRLRTCGDSAGQGPGGFVEVVAAAEPSADLAVVVRLDNGVALEVHAGAEPGWVRELITALRSC